MVFVKWIANYTHSVYKSWSSGHQRQSFDQKSASTYKEMDENVQAKNVILGTRENINLVHEVFRRALLMNFVQSAIIRRVICVYKDWIQMNVPELPVFMLEPDGTPDELRVGSQKILRLFFVNSSAVFLLTDIPNEALLEEQVDICKRVLNIYRYAVMNTRMDAETWEQLLVVMLNVTCKVLDPNGKTSELGSKLSSALFQTLIVSWVKASLNVRVPMQLWDDLQQVLGRLTYFDNLVTEWAKTMETLTRVLSRHVYNLDLNNLPLDRLTEQKNKRIRGKKQSQSEVTSAQSDEPCSIQINNSSTGSNSSKKDPVSRPLKSRLKRSLSDGHIHQAKHPEFLKRSRSLDVDLYSSTTDISSIVSLETNHNTLIDTSLPDQHSIGGSGGGGDQQLSVHQDRLGTGVIEGGDVKGWLPSVAAILWRRMLGVLGDVNQFQYPGTHAHFFQVLGDIWVTLIKIRRNLGVSLDNMCTPKPPELVPPLQLISPWCFQTLDLPREFNVSKLRALSLLCDITLEDSPLGQDFITKFYSSVHRIVMSDQQDLKNEIVRKVGQKLIGKMLPGFTLLLYDLVHCAYSVLSTADLSKTPRMEAATLLANILFVSKVTVDLPVLNPQQLKFSPVSAHQTQELSLMNLLKCSKIEPTSHARVVTVQALAMYVAGLLQQMRLSQATSTEPLQFNENQRNQIETIICILVASVNVENRTVCLVACDLLLCLAHFAPEISHHFSSIQQEIILGLKTSIVNTMEYSGGGRPFEKRLLLALIHCLGEWCMTVQVNGIIDEDCPEYQLLSCVFEALVAVTKGISSTSVYVAKIKDFNVSIPFDDLQQTDGKLPGKESVFLRPEKKQSVKADIETVQLAATNLLYHLETQLGHFPINVSSRCGSIVCENNDSLYEADELSSVIFTLPNLQMFAIDNSRILTVIELENEDLDSYVRFIIRDLSGKSCWDISTLQLMQDNNWSGLEAGWQNNPFIMDGAMPEDTFINSLNPVTNGPRLTLRKRQSMTLPTAANSAHDLDNLDDLLSYIGYTSPECFPPSSGHKSHSGPTENEDDVVSLLVSQRNTEVQHLNSTGFSLFKNQQVDLISKLQNNNFRNSRRLLSQLGYNSWDKRSSVHLLNKDDKLLRELKHLDTQRCREAHKIAVIYVAAGQEDKHSILSNTGGSEDYEDFVSGLGWEVELETHTGFMGGLLRNKTSGETTPYFATSFTEVIFHVSTRMPSETADHLLLKTKHLGNDEVHIIWSEHSRDYRRDIIPTEFCDVLIVIYPLEFGLYRVTINRKPDVPYFGPLYNEAIVEKAVLPHLVRCTAVNASRAKRSSLQYFQHYFEERQQSLKTIMTNHKVRSTFEKFASSLYRPLNPSPLQFHSGCCSRASGSSFASTTTNKTVNSQVAALLDHNISTNVSLHVDSSPSLVQETTTVGSSSVPPSPTPPVPPKRLSIKLGHGLKPKLHTPPVSPSINRR